MSKALLPVKFLWKLILWSLILLQIASLLWDIVNGRSILYHSIFLWLLVAYFVLPRLHRFLAKIYLPNYFIGRTKSGDGLYADPINVAVVGHASDIHKAMRRAGWTKAEHLNYKSSIKMIRASIRKKSYPSAPVSSLFLFGNKQNFAYQQEVNGNPRIRHHVRFWKTPRGWWLPGGYKADWLAAATFDRRVGLSLYTGQITHKIAENIDEERDHLINTLKHNNKIKVDNVKHFSSSYHDRNGGGDKIKTDGSVPFVYL